MRPHGKIFMLFNAHSGPRERTYVLPEIEAALNASGRNYEILDLRKDRTAVVRAAREAAASGGIVAAAGGDGTMSTVAQAAFDADAAFGAVPLGTFNYFARHNGIPLEPAAAARALAGGEERPVQVGLVNGRVFLVSASLGLYPMLLEEREAFKKQYGRTRWVALIAALWTILTRTHPRIVVRIRTDGAVREVRATTLFVGNNPLQLGRLGIDEAQAVEAGQLAAIRVRPASVWGLMSVLAHGAVGRLAGANEVEVSPFREMEVAPVRPKRRATFLKVATDGERVRMKLPLLFQVAPRPLRLVR
jgi:diacylglycerol kinase family enzyme